MVCSALRKQGFLALIISSLSLALLVPGAATSRVTGRSATNTTIPATCVSRDQPNPVAAQYPNNATGTLNGTMAIVPIPLSEARRLTAPYAILDAAYRCLLPDFPAGMYPLFIQGVHDYNIQVYALGVQVPAFSGQLGLPFVDLLGDNHSSFAYTPALMISADSAIALAGSASYGQVPYPSTFDPPCDAYASVAAADHGSLTNFKATDLANGTYISLTFGSPAAAPGSLGRSTANTSGSPYSRAFWQNVTNQPIFADGKTCDGFLRLWNTSLTETPWEPRDVVGRVVARMPPLPATDVSGVWGIQADTPFIEPSAQPCEAYKGYSGTGPGD